MNWEILAVAVGFASRKESDSVALLSQDPPWRWSNPTHLEKAANQTLIKPLKKVSKAFLWFYPKYTFETFSFEWFEWLFFYIKMVLDLNKKMESLIVVRLFSESCLKKKMFFSDDRKGIGREDHLNVLRSIYAEESPENIFESHFVPLWDRRLLDINKWYTFIR